MQQVKIPDGKAYRVHLYAVVRVPVDVPNAASQLDAISRAEKSLDLHSEFRRGEYAEEVVGVLVDEAGDEDYRNSRNYVTSKESGTWVEDRPGISDHTNRTLPATIPYFRHGAIRNKAAQDGWSDAISERINGWGVAKEERHRVTLIKDCDLVFFAPAGADFENPTPLKQDQLDAALTTARQWAQRNKHIPEIHRTPSDTATLPASAMERYLEVTLPHSFDDREHTIFDALDMGATVGRAYDISHDQLDSMVAGLVKATADLVQAVEFTPLGVRGIKAVQAAKGALGDFPASGYQHVRDEKVETRLNQLPNARLFVGEWDHTWSWNEDGRMEVKCRVILDAAANKVVAAQVWDYESWSVANSDQKDDLANVLFVENQIHANPQAFDFIEIDRFPMWAAGVAGDPQLPPYEDDEVIGVNREGHIMQWSVSGDMPIETGQSLAEFGLCNLREHELARVGVSREAWVTATRTTMEQVNMSENLDRTTPFTRDRTRTKPDLLTLAYVAIGARDVLRDMRARGRDCNMDSFNGETGFIDEVLSHALLVDKAADWFDANEGHPCVFAYEVAEPFGASLARAMITNGEVVKEPGAILSEILFIVRYEPNSIQKALEYACKDIPADPEGMNGDRAAWAGAAIEAFRAQTRCDREDAVSDLIANLMHYSDRNGLFFDDELARARKHYADETVAAACSKIEPLPVKTR